MAGYIFTGNYRAAITALRFPKPESFLEPAEERIFRWADPPRTPILGKPDDIKTLKEILTNRTNDQYSQGDYFGAIFTVVPMGFYSYKTLTEDETHRYHLINTKESTNFSVGFLNSKNEPCAFSVCYHPVKPDQWIIAYIRNTCVAPEDRVVKLITSMDYFSEQPGMQRVSAVGLRNQLKSVLKTDALKTLFQDLIHPSGELNIPCIPIDAGMECDPEDLVLEKQQIEVINQEQSYLYQQVAALERKAKKLPRAEESELLWTANRLRRQITRIPTSRTTAIEVIHQIIEDMDQKILDKLPPIAEILARIVNALHIKPAIRFFENRKAKCETLAIESFIKENSPIYS